MKRLIKLIKLSFPYSGFLSLSAFSLFFYTVLNGISVFSIVPLVDRIMSDNPIAIPESMKKLDLPFLSLLQDLIDFLNEADKMRLLLCIGIFIFVIFLFKGIFLYVQQVAMETVGQRVGRDIRSSLYKKYYRFPLTHFAKNRLGELISRITSDVNLIHEVFSGRFIVNVKDALQIIPFLAWILILDWKTSLILMLVLPVLIVPIVMIGRKIRKLSRKTMERVADINSIINETISGIKIVKIFCMEEYEQKRFYNQLDEFKKIRIDFTRKQAIYNPLTEIVGGVAVMFMLIVFPPKVMRGEITAGFFLTYLICLAALIKPLRTVAKLNFAMQNALAALDRIFSLLDSKEGISDDSDASEFPGFHEKIQFSKVHFAYDEEKEVLQNINLDAGINRITAIVGPSGCGKTTLVNLIPRFFDPTGGVISIDGKNIKDYFMRSLRDQIGMVSQETFLFNDTVAGNISYGHEDIPMERIREVSQLAHAHEFIEDLPEKYQTVIGEKGARLSGGQKQRIAIARALLKNPPVLILDEATSALDSESERIVQDAINNLMKSRTVIVIAHRLTTIMKADIIYVMDKGQIVDSGRHEELLKKCELYKRLYEMQFV